MPVQISKSGKTAFKTCHSVFCHTNDQNTRATAKKLGINTSGTAKNCPDCAISKAKQKTINKGRAKPHIPVEDTTKYKPCEKLGCDISNTKMRSKTKNRYWNLTVDHKTKNRWSHFLKRKKHLGKQIVELIKDEMHKKLEKKVSTIRCDNSGENIAFEQMSKDERLGLNFEYTARKTPQQNGIVERMFATMWGMIRSML